MHQGQRIRLITIDLDDTLWPCAPVIRDAEQVLYDWLLAHTPRLTRVHDPISMREHRRDLMLQRQEIAHDITAVRLIALQELMRQFDYPPALADQAMALFQQQRNRVEPYPDVVPALTQLRQCYRLVSLTNGNAQVQNTPLRAAFHHSLSAADAGACKPDPAMFELAMDWAGVAAHQTVHIGDDPLLDVEAARRIGLSGIWVNRAGIRWPHELSPPWHQVPNLSGLPRWLADQAGDESAHAL